LLTVQLRYKEPTSDTSKLISTGVANSAREFGAASENIRFAAAVAAFGMLLKDSPHKGSVTYDGVRDVARGAMSTDLQGYRAEFVRLVGRTGELAKTKR
jgi:Ca-activated chloride channel family protein